ncbi:MAG TPA: Hsp20/alpha crystallin family protein [Pseudonocardiaceae bacterium]|jgi:HSP20 family protein|nr:Hsp20/alpha crystallin family protein [Pseudonocardiaceae bacterium]
MAIAVRGSAWSPFSLVRQFDSEFDALVRRSFGQQRRVAGFVPAADVTKDGNDVVVTLALPGVDVDKDVTIEVTEGRLSVSGSRSSRTESDQDGVLVREISSGSFRRVFTLPKGVTAEHVEADYQDGLLKVRVREAVPQVAAPATIKIRNHAAAELTEQPAAPEEGSPAQAE